jgi:hypothetical protein
MFFNDVRSGVLEGSWFAWMSLKSKGMAVRNGFDQSGRKGPGLIAIGGLEFFPISELLLAYCGSVNPGF